MLQSPVAGRNHSSAWQQQGENERNRGCVQPPVASPKIILRLQPRYAQLRMNLSLQMEQHLISWPSILGSNPRQDSNIAAHSISLHSNLFSQGLHKVCHCAWETRKSSLSKKMAIWLKILGPRKVDLPKPYISVRNWCLSFFGTTVNWVLLVSCTHILLPQAGEASPPNWPSWGSTV